MMSNWCQFTRSGVAGWLVMLLLGVLSSGAMAGDDEKSDDAKDDKAADVTVEEESQGIQFPKFVVLPQPKPQPLPVTAVPVLTPERIYVVESEAEFVLLAVPREAVKITAEVGPLRIRGVFADGDGTVETRTFKSKYLLMVDAVAKKGRVELIAVPREWETEEDFVRQLIDLGHAPQPPPDIDPDVDPEPDVDPDEPLPESELGLVKVAYEAKKLVTGATKGAEAKVIAGAYQKAARFANSSPYRQVTEIQAEARKTGLSAEAIGRWKIAAAPVTDALEKLQVDGKLVNRLQWAQAYEELAAGFLHGEKP